VYFVDKLSLNPSGMGIIRLKLHGFPHFIFHNVIYLPKLQKNLLYLVHIQQQGHYVHMFGGKVEIRKDSNNMVFMTGMEDGKPLKLKGTHAHT
jgi:hypothetical protein